ncbi:MAG: hypothetical protein R3F19_11820 [Verrucomicrobiales bacterium]
MVTIFLSYLSKDPEIIDRLIDGAKRSYSDIDPCDFDSHVSRISALQKNVLKFVVTDGDPDSHREAALLAKDNLTGRTTETGDLAHDEDDVPDFDETVDEILSLNRAFKSMQVLGQVVRNFAGSMKGDRKLDLANECVSVGLRSINYLFSLLQDNLEDVVDYVKERIASRYGDSDPQKLEDRAKLLLFFLCESAASGVTRRIATDVGSPDLAVTYEEMLSENPSVSVEMVSLAIKMDCRVEFPAEDVIQLNAAIAKNVFAKAVLCDMVTSHFYLFRVESHIRQRVCAKLGIGVRENQIHDSSQKRLGRDHKV